MVAWYRHDIPRWRGGTASLTHEQYRLYHVICEQIYLEEEDVAAHVRSLAGLANMSERLATKIIEELVLVGKLSRSETGRLSQTRTKVELERVSNNRRVAKTGGVRSGEVRRNSNKNNDKNEATLHDGTKRPTNRLEKTREENKESSSAPNGAGHMDDWPEDYREQWWALYPRKLEKKAALAKLERIRKSGEVTWATMKAGVERYAAANSKLVDQRFVKHPTTWLSAGCWDDEDMFGTSSQVDDWRRAAG